MAGSRHRTVDDAPGRVVAPHGVNRYANHRESVGAASRWRGRQRRSPVARMPPLVVVKLRRPL
jgi:hypothetical protein